jgi:hypothetical protein
VTLAIFDRFRRYRMRVSEQAKTLLASVLGPLLTD